WSDPDIECQVNRTTKDGRISQVPGQRGVTPAGTIARGRTSMREKRVAEPVLNIEKDEPEELRTTPLDMLHRSLGAKMVPFAGYAMPVQYGPGVMAEHLHCRAKAALFDVSHMGQLSLRGEGAAAALETLV